jgi:signal transduction histidine kinase
MSWPARVLRVDLPRLRALGFDVCLAVVVVVVVDVAITVAAGPGSRPVDALAYILGALMGVPVLGRRRWPLGALLATGAVLLAYYEIGYQDLSPAIPLAVVLYSAASSGRLWWSMSVAGFFVLVGTGVLVVHHREPPLAIFTDRVQIAGLVAVVILLGEVLRSRRVRLAEAAERLQLAEAGREREAARQVNEERLRIAREMHDVLGHTTTVIAVQVQVAADAMADDPEQVATALEAIRSANRKAMTELRATLGVLRDEGVAPLAPAPGLEQLGALGALARAAGVEVDVAVSGRPRPVPAAIQRGAYRIVQESLTNVIRHAGAEHVTVALDYRPEALEIRVVDNGPGTEAGPGPAGLGIVGMRERALALGGWLRAGPGPTGGFEVRAELPTQETQ